MAGGGIKINNIKVSGGADGATFIPSVDSSGTLSWTNNKGYENPAPVNLKGADGKDGINGKDGATGAKIVSTVFYGRDEDDNSIYLQTFDDGSTAFFTASKGRDGNRILYFRDEAKPYFEEEDEEYFSLGLPLKRFLGTPKANDFVISADGYLFDVERIVEETAVCEYLTEIKGERGSLWYSGDTPPIEGIKENDHFLDTNTLDIYIYDGEKWGKIGSLAVGGTAETGDFVSKDGDIITGALLFNSSRTMQQALVSPNGFEVGVGVDGESVAVDKTEYGNGGITKTEGDTIKDFALPEKSGTLATEDKARELAKEEIAKYDFIKIVEALPETGLPNRFYLIPKEAEEGSTDLFDMWIWANDAWEFEGTKSAEIDGNLYVKKVTTTGSTLVYGVDHNGNQIMKKVAAGENTFTRGGIPISASYGAIFQNGVISENDANYKNYTVNRGYADDTFLMLAGGTLTGKLTLAQGDGNGIDLGTAGVINSGDNTVLGFLNSELMMGSYNSQTVLRTKAGTKLVSQVGSNTASRENIATEPYADQKADEAKKYADNNFAVNTYALCATDATIPGITKLALGLGSMAVIFPNDCGANITYKTRNYDTNAYDTKTAVSGEEGTLLLFLSENYEKGWGYTLTVVKLSSTNFMSVKIPKTETTNYLIDIQPTANVDNIVTVTISTAGAYRRITTVGTVPAVLRNDN